MTDENIRFREARAPKCGGRSSRRLPNSIFEYDNHTFCMASTHSSALDGEDGELPYLCRWARATGEYYYLFPAYDSLKPEVHQAAQVWAAGGYGEMSLAEFLNATVPQ